MDRKNKNKNKNNNYYNYYNNHDDNSQYYYNNNENNYKNNKKKSKKIIKSEENYYDNFNNKTKLLQSNNSSKILHANANTYNSLTNSKINNSGYTCTICRELKCHFSIGECNHYQICLYCVLKIRLLYKDNRCPICKSNNKDIIFYEYNEEDNSILKNYQDIKTEDCYKDQNYNDNGILYNDVSSMEEVIRLISYKCPISSCNDPLYDNLKSLSIHLNKSHKRYFCEICIRDGKRFIPEATIFTFEELKAHNLYGEFDEYWNIIVPIHPICQFCETYYYNDEALINHMKDIHFECTICSHSMKSKIYYNDIIALHIHGKFRHFQCPYPECINEFFVTFDSRSKAIDHMNTKHNCKDSNKMLDNYKNNLSDPFNPHIKLIDYYDNSFNATELLQKLKNKIEDYSKQQKSQQLQLGDFNYDEETSSIVYNYVNNNNTYIKGNQNKIKDNYNNSNNINDNNSNMKYKIVEYEENGITVNRKIPIIDNKQITKDSKIIMKKFNERPSLNIIDYSSFFKENYNYLKNYITNLIKTKDIPEKELFIPKEVGYQLIMMISKLENKEMAELKFLSNFAYGFSLIDEILHCLAYTQDFSLEKTLNDIPLSKLLILYKYIHICYLKVNNCFYKKDEDLVEEDVYDEFIPRSKPKNKNINIKSAIEYSINPNKNKVKYDKIKKNKNKIIKSDNIKINNDKPPYIGHNMPYNYKINDSNSNSKLNNLFCESRDDNSLNNVETDKTKLLNKSKLGKLLDKKLIITESPEPELKNKEKKSMIKNGVLNEEDFPKLS